MNCHHIPVKIIPFDIREPVLFVPKHIFNAEINLPIIHLPLPQFLENLNDDEELSPINKPRISPQDSPLRPMMSSEELMKEIRFKYPAESMRSKTSRINQNKFDSENYPVLGIMPRDVKPPKRTISPQLSNTKSRRLTRGDSLSIKHLFGKSRDGRCLKSKKKTRKSKKKSIRKSRR